MKEKEKEKGLQTVGDQFLQHGSRARVAKWMEDGKQQQQQQQQQKVKEKQTNKQNISSSVWLDWIDSLQLQAVNNTEILTLFFPVEILLCDATVTQDKNYFSTGNSLRYNKFRTLHFL